MALRRRPGSGRRTAPPSPSSGSSPAGESRPASGSRPAGERLVDRFGPAVRSVIVASEAQAQADGSTEIAVHHLVLAAATVPGGVAWSLATAGLDRTTLRDALVRTGGAAPVDGDGRVPLVPDRARTRVPFSEEARAVLGVAAAVADRRRRPLVEPDDLVVAALGRPSAAIGAALADLRIDPAVLRQQVLAGPELGDAWSGPADASTEPGDG